jgi:Glyoxalase-like domain
VLAVVLAGGGQGTLLYFAAVRHPHFLEEVHVLVDHLIYATPDLRAAVAELEGQFGIRARAGGKHVGVGTHNALLALGSRTYLEIIAPDPDQPEPPVPRPFGIGSVNRGRLVGWALACDNIDRAVAEARGHGYDPGEIVDGHRVGPEGTVLRWRTAIGELADDLVPFLICWGDTEHPARSAPHGLILNSIEIEHPDPPSLAPALMALGANVEVRQGQAPALVAHLSGPNGSKVLR